MNNKIIQHVKKILFTVLLFYFCHAAIAGQVVTLSGTVVNNRNKAPIPFADIKIQGTNIGTITDINGNFTISSTSPFDTIIAAHASYYTKYIAVSSLEENAFKILLQEKFINLKIFKIENENNPAWRIIDSVVHNAHKNDISRYPSVTMKVYERFVVTIDTVYTKTKNKNTLKKLDTTKINPVKYFSDKELFITENVVERSFVRPDNIYDKVIGTKAAGFKSPLFNFLNTMLQPASIYNNTIIIGNSAYINPVSEKGTLNYHFNLESISFSEKGDSIFEISYEPIPGSTFKGLQGKMWVNQNGWAIQNIVTMPFKPYSSLFNLQLLQSFHQLDSGWFPYQQFIDIYIPQAFVTSAQMQYPIKASGKSYISDIRINSSTDSNNLGEIGIEFLPDAAFKDSNFWNKNRAIPLSEKEKNTYTYIDSLSNRLSIERKLYILIPMLEGKIAINKVNIDVNKMIEFARYEGIRLG